MKYVITYVLEHNSEDLAFLDKRLSDEDKTKPQAERNTMTLLEKLNFVNKNLINKVTSLFNFVCNHR